MILSQCNKCSYKNSDLSVLRYCLTVLLSTVGTPVDVIEPTGKGVLIPPVLVKVVLLPPVPETPIQIIHQIQIILLIVCSHGTFSPLAYHNFQIVLYM